MFLMLFTSLAAMPGIFIIVGLQSSGLTGDLANMFATWQTRIDVCAQASFRWPSSIATNSRSEYRSGSAMQAEPASCQTASQLSRGA